MYALHNRRRRASSLTLHTARVTGALSLVSYLTCRRLCRAWERDARRRRRRRQRHSNATKAADGQATCLLRKTSRAAAELVRTANCLEVVARSLARLRQSNNAGRDIAEAICLDA